MKLSNVLRMKIYEALGRWKCFQFFETQLAWQKKLFIQHDKEYLFIQSKPKWMTKVWRAIEWQQKVHWVILTNFSNELFNTKAWDILVTWPDHYYCEPKMRRYKSWYSIAHWPGHTIPLLFHHIWWPVQNTKIPWNCL